MTDRDLTLIIFFIMLACMIPLVSDAKVSNVIMQLTELAPRHPARQEPYHSELTEAIERAAIVEQVPEILLTVMVFTESSFRFEAIGPINEKGLMQVHGTAAKGCDLTTVYGQVSCGAKWLSSRINECGGYEGGITSYMSGSCKSESINTKFLVNRRLELFYELEGE